jgi:hypothetical protein
MISPSHAYGIRRNLFAVDFFKPPRARSEQDAFEAAWKSLSEDRVTVSGLQRFGVSMRSSGCTIALQRTVEDSKGERCTGEVASG